MGIIALVVLIVFYLVGLVLTPLGLPGTFIILAGAVAYNLIQWAMALSLSALGFLLGIALIGEVLEYVLSVTLASRRGASNPAIWGAVIGGILGAIIGTPMPIVGSVVGLFIGVFLGAFVVEMVLQKDVTRALRSAIGAFYGRVGAIVTKSMLGVVMVIIIFVSIF